MDLISIYKGIFQAGGIVDFEFGDEVAWEDQPREEAALQKIVLSSAVVSPHLMNSGEKNDKFDSFFDFTFNKCGEVINLFLYQ